MTVDTSLNSYGGIHFERQVKLNSINPLSAKHDPSTSSSRLLKTSSCFAAVGILKNARITHVGPAGGHEDGKVCEVAAGAGGCVAVDVQRLAAVGGPAALQAVRLVLPEGALGHVSLRVDWLLGG